MAAGTTADAVGASTVDTTADGAMADVKMGLGMGGATSVVTGGTTGTGAGIGATGRSALACKNRGTPPITGVKKVGPPKIGVAVGPKTGVAVGPKTGVATGPKVGDSVGAKIGAGMPMR